MRLESNQNTNTFFCHGCGLCCQSVGLSLKNKDKVAEPWKTLLNEFPYKTKADGSCEMLDENNQCKVYDDRPTLCNVAKLKDIVHPEQDLDTYYREQEGHCKSLMKKAGYSNNGIKKIYNGR